MKVYVIIRHWQYDCSEILSIFSASTVAETKRNEIIDEELKQHSVLGGRKTLEMDIVIQEWDVD